MLSGDWENTFFEMLEAEIVKVLKGIREYWSLSPKPVEATVRAGVDTLTTHLDEEKDILITSPPYLQSQEYIRQAKMDLFWLGYTEKQIRRLRSREIPYRNATPCPIYSETYDQLRASIEERHLRRIFDNYFWGVLGALTCLQDGIRRYIFVFVGRASMRGRPIPIDRIIAEHFTALGWVHEATLVDTIVARRLFAYEVNPATGIRDQRTKTENLVILRKP